MRIALVVLGLTACVSSNSQTCPNGFVCPGDTTCVTLTNPNPSPLIDNKMPQLCVTADQQKACVGVPDGTTCTDPLKDEGTCYGGVCIQPAGCGNGWVDPGEVCDDHNLTSGDGCSADCLSNETCGNGHVDPVKIVNGTQVPNEQCDGGTLVDHTGCDSACRPEQARWSLASEVPMAGLTNTEMVYDVAHDQIVLFGGDDQNGNIVDATWLWDGYSWELASPPASPPARDGHALAYDAARHRVVLFGGVGDHGYRNDTWEWDGFTWTQRFPPIAPTVRAGAAMAYDAGRKRVVLFGGSEFTDTLSGAKYFADTWEWDGTSWTQITTATVPGSRAGAAMAYDPARGRIVMYGGITRVRLGAMRLDDTYEYDGTDWTLRASGTPTGREGARMAWDRASGRVMLFGGNDGNNDLGEAWSWSGTAWSSLATGPGPRSAFGMADNGSVVVVDGVIGPQTETVARTWTWNGSSWSEVTPTPPATFITNQVAFDELRRLAIMVDPNGDTWLGNGMSWHAAIAAPQFTGRVSAGLAYDEARDRTVLYSGVDNTGMAVGDTWEWNGSTWLQRTPAASPPARSSPLAYDRARKRIVMFGGASDAALLDDTWEFDGTTWTQMTPAVHPPARHSHALVYDPLGARVILYGGDADDTGNNLTPLGDAWAWDGASWKQLSSALAPVPRADPMLAWNGSRGTLVLFGGVIATGNANDLWELAGAQWSQLDAGVAPPPRARGAWFPLADGKGLALFSGTVPGVVTGGPVPLGDTWRLRWDGTLDESCVANFDLDGDGLAGCNDHDCWAVCSPLCSPQLTIPPGMKTCDDSLPRCGDTHCDPVETCRNCPADCGACKPVCGDSFCDAPETAATCPGDCP